MTDEKSNPTDSSKLQSAEIIYPTPIQKASPLAEFAPEVRVYLSQNPEVAGQILITGYGIVHKDSTLADKVFTGAMGLLGGAGGLAVLNQKKDQEAEKK